jgi:ABC-type uncharacterized transport system fused permease/ATPase subunit
MRFRTFLQKLSAFLFIRHSFRVSQTKNMSQSLQCWMKLFYLTGTSVKVFFEKSLFSKICSIAAICFYVLNFVAAFSISIQYGFVPLNDSQFIYLVMTFFWALCFGAILVILLTITKAKFEAKFWNIMSQVENNFETEMEVKFIHGKFKKTFVLKIIFLLFR